VGGPSLWITSNVDISGLFIAGISKAAA